MIKSVKTFGRLVVAVALFSAAALPAHAESAAQTVVRTFYGHLVSTMKQGAQLGFDGRYKKLEPAIREAFNLPLMTKVSVGASWAGASAQEQSDLTAAFANFTIATYANRFAAYDDEQFTVTGEKPVGKDTIVETTLKPKGGDAIALNYLLHADDKGNYRIVDVMLNGMVSEMATRRSEFSAIARREGIPALVNSLSEKAKAGSAS